MFCPLCRTEYRPGFTRCADCDVELVESLPPELDESLPPEPTDGKPLPVDERLKGVRGWLLFFVILLTCINPLGTVRDLVSYYVELESTRSMFQPSLFIFFFIHAVSYVGVSGFGVYAGIALWRIRPGAVRLAKRFLLTFLVWGCADLSLTLWLQGSQADFVKGLRNVVWWCGLWYFYLARSKRVAATYSLGSSSYDEHAADVPSALPDGWNPQETTIEVWSGEDPRLVQTLRDCFFENAINCAALSEPAGTKRIVVRSRDEARAREILHEILDGLPPS